MAVVAVGSYTDPLNPLATVASHAHPLAEEWNGRTWRVMPGMHVDGAADVSCTSARFCVAVGGRQVPQIGNGTRWQRLPTPTR